jgi:hypothetical protein
MMAQLHLLLINASYAKERGRDQMLEFDRKMICSSTDTSSDQPKGMLQQIWQAKHLLWPHSRQTK